MVDAQDAIHRTEEIRVISKMSLGQGLALGHRSESASVRASCGPRIMRVNACICEGHGALVVCSPAIKCDVKYHMTRDFLVPNRYGLLAARQHGKS